MVSNQSLWPLCLEPPALPLPTSHQIDLSQLFHLGIVNIPDFFCFLGSWYSLHSNQGTLGKLIVQYKIVMQPECQSVLWFLSIQFAKNSKQSSH